MFSVNLPASCPDYRSFCASGNPANLPPRGVHPQQVDQNLRCNITENTQVVSLKCRDTPEIKSSNDKEIILNFGCKEGCQLTNENEDDIMLETLICEEESNQWAKMEGGDAIWPICGRCLLSQNFCSASLYVLLCVDLKLRMLRHLLSQEADAGHYFCSLTIHL